MPFENGNHGLVHNSLAVLMVGVVAAMLLLAVFLAAKDCQKTEGVDAQCSARCPGGDWERYAYEYEESAEGTLIPHLQCFCAK